jgi:hypothetical protein
MDEERPTTEDPETSIDEDVEPVDDTEPDEDRSVDEAPPAADPEETVDEDIEPEASDAPAPGTPGIPPPSEDTRLSPEGLPQTTTTGDPAKDFRGPSVAEEARDAMEGDPALDEPGYGDLGHAEDHRTLRRD